MRITIVGAGKLGYKLAEALSGGHHDVVMLDINEKALEGVNDNLDVLTIRANGGQISILEQINIKHMDLLISVADSDETNIFIASMAKQLGCKKVIARVRNPEYSGQTEFIKEHMGLDVIINPDLETAKDIAKYLLKGQAIYMEGFAKGKVGMANFKVLNSDGMEGKKIKDLEISVPILIAAILRDGEVIIPNGDVEILPSDVIYIMGEKENIKIFSKSYGISIDRRVVKKAIILGGGKIAYYLARKLMQSGVTVKIIEQDKERCKYLVEELPGALIINGDGTDHNLLAEENVAESDALILLTGYDEENLILGLLGKKYGVDKVIAKVSRKNYISVIEELGIDFAVNPISITASEILRMIQGGRVVSLSLLLGDGAEVLEIIATENSLVVEKQLRDIGLPKGIIIGAIVHKDKVVIPNGDSRICAGDRLIIFCLQSEVTSIEKFFYRPKGGRLNELWNNYKGARKSTSI